MGNARFLSGSELSTYMHKINWAPTLRNSVRAEVGPRTLFLLIVSWSDKMTRRVHPSDHGPCSDRIVMTSTTKRTKRRNTAQDHATLRLHSDGRRVNLRSPQRSDPYHSVGHDTRGNRVARDAAGPVVIAKRPGILKDSGPDIYENESRSEKPCRSNRGKRRRLNHDVEFLRYPRNVSGSGDVARGTSWSVPSSV